MKFKFCGNIDCPEWIISEIIFLTKISTVKLRIICNHIVIYIINNGKNLKEIKKMLEEMNFTETDALIIISVLEFIIKNSAKFDVEDIILNQELQQLGLPQENADSISKVFKNSRENLKSLLKQDVFSMNKINQIDYKISYVLANNFTDFDVKNDNDVDDGEGDYKINNIDSVKINLCFDRKYHLTTDKEMLGKLINDLEKSAELIKKYKEQS
jgi:hypothetical protein